MVIAKGGAKLQPSTSTGAPLIRVGRDQTNPTMSLLVAQNVEMAEWVENLNSRSIGGLVVDNTGLDGRYSFRLKWQPEAMADGATDGLPSGPSIFTAFQEQLGLKLESRKIRTDVMVVDSIKDQPTTDPSIPHCPPFCSSPILFRSSW